MIGDQTDLFLSLNEGQVTAELVHRESVATLKAYIPSTPNSGAQCHSGQSRRWHHVSMSLTSRTFSMSVNHQPLLERDVESTEAVKLLQRLTVGGGTASGKEIHVSAVFIRSANCDIQCIK